MGRRLEFNREVALTRATELFWKRGYVNTSLAQLLKAMKLGEGSFYNTFKSKKRLYLECLQHYNATFMQRRVQALGADGSVRERLTEFFDVVVEDATTFKAAGCLVSNSVSNEVLSERELKNYLFGGFGDMLADLEELLEQGKRSGQLPGTLRAKTIARVLFTYLHGLHRLSAYELDLDARKAEVRAFLDGVLVGA